MYKITKEQFQKDEIVEQGYIDSGIQRIEESSDIAQTLKELNDDTIDKDKFSNMDMKAILHPVELSSINAFDTLVALDFLPAKSLFLTRSKKRLSPSQFGKGREQMVSIAQGMQQQKQGTSFLDRMSNIFSSKQN